MVSRSVSSSPTELSEPPEDFETSDHEIANQPPSKRRCIGDHLRGSPATIDSPSSTAHNNGHVLDDVSDVSSDSEASVPGHSRLANVPGGVQDEDSVGGEQMRVCSWDGCGVGELANQDELVQHVHREHVDNAKKAKFACEWSDCKAKGKAQGSAYALRAHIRSHTKEKPFYCLLPECDKCFTRSDALAKHMRTVHENEGARTAEHYAKKAPNATGAALETPSSPPEQQSSTSKAPKSIKLHFNSNKGTASASSHDIDGDVAPAAPLSPKSREAIFGPFPEGTEFSEREAALPRDQLFGLLRRQMQWAKRDAADLAREIAAAEELRKHEWLAKELALDNLLEADLQAVKATDGWNPYDGLLPLPEHLTDEEVRKLQEDYFSRRDSKQSELRKLPLSGTKEPWYRKSEAKERDGVFDRGDEMRDVW